MRNLPEFGRQMDQLAAAFNRPPSQSTKDAYREALAGLTDDEFRAAVNKALTACDRWPVPKVLMGFAMEERGRMRAASRFTAPDTAHCPTCGGTPQWTTGRMHLRHLEGFPCERYNAGKVWEAVEPNWYSVKDEPNTVSEPDQALAGLKSATLRALRGPA